MYHNAVSLPNAQVIRGWFGRRWLGPRTTPTRNRPANHAQTPAKYLQTTRKLAANHPQRAKQRNLLHVATDGWMGILMRDIRTFFLRRLTRGSHRSAIGSGEASGLGRSVGMTKGRGLRDSVSTVGGRRGTESLHIYDTTFGISEKGAVFMMTIARRAGARPVSERGGRQIFRRTTAPLHGDIGNYFPAEVCGAATKR